VEFKLKEAGVDIVTIMSVCGSVCLSLSLRVYLMNHMSTFDQIFCAAHVACNCGSVRQWRRCSMLRISGFVDGVMFSNNGPNSTGNATAVEVQSDSPGGSTDLTPRCTLKLTQHGQHHTGSDG